MASMVANQIAVFAMIMTRFLLIIFRILIKIYLNLNASKLL